MKTLYLTLLISATAWAGGSPEFVRIYKINDKEIANHPAAIDVRPGEQISFRADVVQFGEACAHSAGCPEGRHSEEFRWTAEGAAGNFEPRGEVTVFRVPESMPAEIRLTVSHGAVSTSDSIVLRNLQLAQLPAAPPAPVVVSAPNPQVVYVVPAPPVRYVPVRYIAPPLIIYRPYYPRFRHRRR